MVEQRSVRPKYVCEAEVKVRCGHGKAEISAAEGCDAEV